MTKENILLEIQKIFHDVFEDDSIKLSYSTSAEDIEEWDSLNHISLVISTEKKFNVKFALGELQELQNIGDMINLILEKTE